VSLREALEQQAQEQHLAAEAGACEEKWLRSRQWTLERVVVTANGVQYEVDAYRVHLDWSIQLHVLGTPSNQSTGFSAGSWSKKR